MLSALCKQLGYQVFDCGIVEDSLEATKSALSNAASKADVIITSGGVSVGEEDHIRPAIESLGSINHWKVQMKPGKPVVLGRIFDTPILGLPGNPVSSYVVFQMLGLPLLRTLQGERFREPTAFAMIANFEKKASSREEYIRVSLRATDNGAYQVELFNNQSSGVLSSLTWADGLVRQRIDQKVSRGDIVDFLPMREGLV
jgi:molybdopterin molybdotransferase